MYQEQVITVNVEISAQSIFSRISRMVSDTRKYDVSENLNHYRLIGISTKCAKICRRENVTKGLMCRNLAAQKYLRSQ